MLVLAWRAFSAATISGQFPDNTNMAFLLNTFSTVYTGKMVLRLTAAPCSSRKSLYMATLVRSSRLIHHSVSSEQDAFENHNIEPNGYNAGR